MGRILAIDWGERRIGVALSDESRTIAAPHTVIHRGASLDKDLARIADMVIQEEVDLVVLGMPVRLDGTMGPEADGVAEVAGKLGDRIEVPVETWDERFSTVAAERTLIGGDVSRKRRKNLVDQVAAALFLQSYMDWDIRRKKPSGSVGEE